MKMRLYGNGHLYGDPRRSIKICTSTHAALVIHKYSIIRKTYYAALILVKDGKHVETYVYTDDTPTDYIQNAANKAKNQLMQIGFSTDETLRIIAHWLDTVKDATEVFNKIYGGGPWK